MAKEMFTWFVCCTILLIVLAPGCKPLPAKKYSDIEGVYIVTAARAFDSDSQFDIRDTPIWPPPGSAGPIATTVTDKELTLGDGRNHGRCLHCHDCLFPSTWDADNYGTPNWSPKYTGKEWAPSVQRMRMKNNSLMNEKLADRIYEFLRLETLGEYDESTDDKGAFVIQR